MRRRSSRRSKAKDTALVFTRSQLEALKSQQAPSATDEEAPPEPKSPKRKKKVKKASKRRRSTEGKPMTKSAKAKAKRSREQKAADDLATDLQHRVGKARDSLASVKEQLEKAIQENILLRSTEQAAAADRALARAREWHRIHRKLNHPSKKVTDAEYLSGDHRKGKDKGLFKKLPHHTEKYCVVCDQAKFTEDNKPLFQDKIRKARRPGETWHADVGLSVRPFPSF